MMQRTSTHGPILRSMFAILVTCGLTATAAAQGQRYDANCNKRDYSKEEKVQQEICSGHVGCRFVMLAEKACVVKDFLGNLGDKLTGRSQPDNMDVVEALTETEVVQTTGVKAQVAKVRSNLSQSRMPPYDRSNAAQISIEENQPYKAADGTFPTQGYLNKRSGGFIEWFEGKKFGSNNAGEYTGVGAEISNAGAMRAGTLSPGLEGESLSRQSGGWQGGNFEKGQLNGSGFQTLGSDSGKSPVMEGTFLNGKADGMMLVTYSDFSSRKELWKNGQMIAAGPTVAKGAFPPNPRTPEEETAAKLAARLSGATNAGALYALGDELAEQGDTAGAKAAWRELLGRFPDSPFAMRAADRLGGSNTSAGSSTKTAGLTGIWIGESTGNRVYMLDEGTQIRTSVSGIPRAGQADGVFIYMSTGNGQYVYRFPNGNAATIMVLGPGRIRAEHPGSSEIFARQ